MSRFEYEQCNLIERRFHQFANKRRIPCSFIGRYARSRAPEKNTFKSYRRRQENTTKLTWS